MKPDSVYAQGANPDQGYAKPCVSFKRVGLRYGRSDEVLADIDFDLSQGSLNFITGPSGAGKTSLLKLIYLHMRPSRGLITLFGQDSSQIPRSDIPKLKQRMGIVLQDFHLVEHLSVFENVCLPLRMAGMPREEYRDDVISLLRWVGLGSKMRALPVTLSSGEQQRAAIARAVITKPDILIADEPTGNVDREAGSRIIRLFLELNRLGTTIIVATHNHSLIPAGSDVFAIEQASLVKRAEVY